MAKVFDVIVAGAGPAGATAAFELALRGCDVLLLEKEILPRYKCCAGGVTVRTVRLLNFDISHLVEQTITGARIDFHGQSYCPATYKDAVLYTVNRDDFDCELVRQAQSAGVTCLQGVCVTDVHNLETGVKVVTSAGNFKGAFLIGADGAYSIVAKKAGIPGKLDYIIGVNNEIEACPNAFNERLDCVYADIGCIQAGYGWIFPKKDHLSIGIASLAHGKAHGLRDAYERFLKQLSLSNYRVRRRSGHIIPVLSRERPLYSGRIILTGDAAGLADPLTGEGIYSAVLSGQLAARALYEALQDGKERLAGYQNAVEATIFPELRIACVLRNLFIRFPSAVFGVLKSEEKFWRGGCRLARGEIDYSFARKRIGGYKQIYAYLLAALRV